MRTAWWLHPLRSRFSLLNRRAAGFREGPEKAERLHTEFDDTDTVLRRCCSDLTEDCCCVRRM